MYQPIYTKRFEKDLEKFKQIAQSLICGQALDAKYRDHIYSISNQEWNTKILKNGLIKIVR